MYFKSYSVHSKTDSLLSPYKLNHTIVQGREHVTAIIKKLIEVSVIPVHAA